jgi:hypothetical protein
MKKIKPEHIAQADWDDVDSPPLNNSVLATMKPVRAEHPAMQSRLCGPQAAAQKSSFRATGRGWQSRINDALRDWLKEHKPAL